MKKIKIIARERITNPSTGEIYSDERLFALDGYREAVMDVEENYDVHSVMLHFEEKYPEAKGWDCELLELN